MPTSCRGAQDCRHSISAVREERGEIGDKQQRRGVRSGGISEDQLRTEREREGERTETAMQEGNRPERKESGSWWDREGGHERQQREHTQTHEDALREEAGTHREERRTRRG